MAKLYEAIQYKNKKGKPCLDIYLFGKLEWTKELDEPMSEEALAEMNEWMEILMQNWVFKKEVYGDISASIYLDDVATKLKRMMGLDDGTD